MTGKQLDSTLRGITWLMIAIWAMVSLGLAACHRREVFTVDGETLRIRSNVDVNIGVAQAAAARLTGVVMQCWGEASGWVCHPPNNDFPLVSCVDDECFIVHKNNETSCTQMTPAR